MRRLIPLLVLIVSGCGPQVYAPSLSPRAAERDPIDLPARQAEAEVPADPALVARIAPLMAAAERADAAFAAERRRAEPIVAAAAGSARASEAWTQAQQAVSVLDVARGPLHEAAQGIEDLRSDPAAAGSGSRAAIDAAAQRIAAMERAEQAALDALTDRLR